MFLMIENDGTFDKECLMLLGVSSSREDESKIGMFGSGTKHAICCLLRKGIIPQIFIGEEKLEIAVKTTNIKDVTGRSMLREIITFDGLVTSLSTAFGAIDWTSVGMALREFISNAIDASVALYQDPVKGIRISIETQLFGVSGKTRIYVAATDDVMHYYRRLGENFLHFKGKQSDLILEKKVPSLPKIYRMGVLVGEIGETQSLFDYNIPDITLDESRNVASYTACEYAARNVRNFSIPQFVHYLRTTRTTNLWEDTFSAYVMGEDISSEQALKVRTAWETTFPGKIVITQDRHIIQEIGDDGVIMSHMWCRFLESCGVPSYKTRMTEERTRGMIVKEPSEYFLKAAKTIWKMFFEMDLITKERPVIKSFDYIGSGFLWGNVQGDTIFLNETLEGFQLYQTIWEEMCHYLSGHRDHSKDFQEYIFKVLTKATHAEIQASCASFQHLPNQSKRDGAA